MLKTLGLTTVQLLWAATGDTLLASDAAIWCEYTGQTGAVAQSWEWINGLASAEHEAVRKLWYASIERKRQFETQYHIFHNNDGYHTFRVKCVPLFNGDQSIECWAVWLTEIDTVAQSLEQEDFQMHSLYRLIFEQASIGMSCRSLDGYNLEVNEQYCHILRSPREELLNKYYGLFVHPDGKDAAATFIQQLLLDNLSVHATEGRGLRLDGTSFWYRLTTTLLRHPSGEPQMLLTLLEDSTLEKQAAEEREKEDHVLQALNALSTLLEVLVQKPEHVNNEAEVENAILAQIDSMGEYIAVAKLTTLVVERVRLLGEWAKTRASELALEKVNSHFDAFLNIASHELRTPLTTIKGNVQLALRRLETLQQQGVKQPETLESTLERVRLPLKCAIQRANIQDQLITDLLDASRLQANQLVLTLQYCNLTEIVCNVVTDIQISSCNQHFSLYLPEWRSVFVLADAERVKQVVRNYIINAIKRSPEAAEISITLDVEEVSVRFTVHDKGLGISPKCQEHIWEPFSASTSTDICHYTANEDLGLSLYLCNKIVEYHHGCVGLYSEPADDTAFWFVLPLAETRSPSIFPASLQSSLQ